MKLGFLGLGKLGLPVAEVFAQKGFKVTGYDILPKFSTHFSVLNSIQECVENSDIIFIAVPTPHDVLYDGSMPTSHLAPRDFDYTQVKNCLAEANQYMNKKQILVLISTVLPGTIRQQLSILVDKTNLIYNPYLIAMGSVAYDMTNPEMIIIGTDTGIKNKNTDSIENLYKKIMNNSPRYIIGTWEECECIKIFYNTFISTKISLVNMIQDVSMKLKNINVDIVTNALSESSMRIMSSQYMTAGSGDGGPCHPRDNIALRYLVEKLNLGYDIFGAIMHAREKQAENLAKFLVELASTNSMNIVIHGQSYKPGVRYIDGSYSILVGNFCEKFGFLPLFVDPLTDNIHHITEPSVVLLAHPAKITENSKYSLYFDIPKNSIIVDLWRSFKSDKFTVIPYGNTRLTH